MQRFSNILYVLDPATLIPWALDRACKFAVDTQASLTLMMVADQVAAVGGMSQEHVDRAVLDECDVRLSEMMAGIEQRSAIARKVEFGRLHIQVIREVIAGGYDLVIKAAEAQGGLLERMLGSRDMHLLRKCPCPVWLLKHHGGEHYRRILAAIDFAPDAEDAENRGLNERILDWASSIALAEFAELHIVHAWDALAAGVARQLSTSGLVALNTSADEFRYLDAIRNQHRQSLEGAITALSARVGPAGFEYLGVTSHLPRGPAIDVIPRLADELAADLIVMGTVGRGGIPGLLIGNTAETILNRCECAVLAIKPPKPRPERNA